MRAASSPRPAKNHKQHGKPTDRRSKRHWRLSKKLRHKRKEEVDKRSAEAEKYVLAVWQWNRTAHNVCSESLDVSIQAADICEKITSELGNEEKEDEEGGAPSTSKKVSEDVPQAKVDCVSL